LRWWWSDGRVKTTACAAKSGGVAIFRRRRRRSDVEPGKNFVVGCFDFKFSPASIPVPPWSNRAKKQREDVSEGE